MKLQRKILGEVLMSACEVAYFLLKEIEGLPKLVIAGGRNGSRKCKCRNVHMLGGGLSYSFLNGLITSVCPVKYMEE